MTETTKGQRRPWYRTWWIWAIIGVLLVIGGAVNASSGNNGTEAAAPAETVEPAAEETQGPTKEPEEPVKEAPALDETFAAQYLALAWEDRMTYGGTAHWITDTITTANEDGTYTFKIGATIKDAYGNKFGATIEGDVGGTSGAPVIIDSIMYTDAGEVINYHE